ncbi:MAG: hypothetical protein ACYTHK_05130 [Planctomycetota bacterium]
MRGYIRALRQACRVHACRGFALSDAPRPSCRSGQPKAVELQ